MRIVIYFRAIRVSLSLKLQEWYLKKHGQARITSILKIYTSLILKAGPLR